MKIVEDLRLLSLEAQLLGTTPREERSIRRICIND